MILACDPAYGKKSAFALLTHKGTLVKTFKTNDVAVLHKEISVLDIRFFCEDQFFFKNNDTLKKLARQTGKFEAIMDLFGIPTEYIKVMEWQGYFRLPRKDKTISAYHWKKIHQRNIIDCAISATGIDITDDDIASAILIGLYAEAVK